MGLLAAILPMLELVCRAVGRLLFVALPMKGQVYLVYSVCPQVSINISWKQSCGWAAWWHLGNEGCGWSYNT